MVEPANMNSESLSSILREMAFLGELQEENPFKLRAWANSARILEEDSRDVKDLVASGEIASIAGVGKGTQAIAKEFVETGRVQEHEALRAAFPATIFELLEVPGLGPKKAKALYKELGIGGLSELEYACQENRLTELKGFGAKTQSSILLNIQKLKSNRGKAILPAALIQADDVQEELEALSGVELVEVSGELRRLNEVISALDFVVAGAPETEAGLLEAGFVGLDDGSYRRVRADSLTVTVWLVEVEEFGSKLLETTGPAKYVESLGPIPNAAREMEVYQELNIRFLPPECRDVGACAEDLLVEGDIKGVFHLHTNWSDGRHTLEEMVIAAKEQGLEYIGLSDHSQTAFYANGLTNERVAQQKAEVARVQEKYPEVRIFHGIESDILADGSLDFPDEVLKEFDFVIASVHGQMKMNREDMTRRLVKVLEHPATTWLGHWTGRLLLGREGFDFDHEEVLRAAAANGKGIELNANPYRLDMDWREAGAVAAKNISIGIFPDAHSTGGLADVKYGVWMARKAGLSKGQIVNTKTRGEMEAWLQQRKFR
ncbi:MAG: DNA polymerase/3'-5' exonuclease PolX [Proteobacteria bacterium]|nr:MAG: DNA polymerase/3'-5' exonuclease PolX [Pseudomonadota bacterium]